MLFWGTGIVLAARSPDGLTVRFDQAVAFDNAYDGELIAFLIDEGETRGYSNYWVSYRLAFLSKEEIVFAPALPFKEGLTFSAGDDRYPAYGEWVEASENPALITTRLPELDEILRDELNGQGISADEKDIGPYHIFYNLSGRFDPARIIWPDPSDP
jgi:hypothetical protein